MKHYVLTRFSLDIKGFSHISDIPGIVNKRISIFETYTLPSMIAQTYQDFKWLLFCGEKEKEEINYNFNKWKKQCPQLELFWHMDFISNQNKFFSQWAVENIKGNEPLIQTRLDSDDLICKHFLQGIQNKAFEINSQCILSYPFGHQMCNNKIHLYKHLRNPFTSLFTIGKSSLCIYSVSQSRLEELGPIEIIDNIPRWIRYLHAYNVEGHRKTEGRKEISIDKLVSQFPVLF